MSTALEKMTGAGMSGPAAKGIVGGYSTIAATGSAIGDAASVSNRGSNCIVTAADGIKGVAIAGEIGDSFLLFNNAGSTLKVYPESTAAISISGNDLGTTGAAVSLASYKSGLYQKITATQWISVLSA